ncbi:DUF3267 domain-containing protein [Dyadobacter sp. CY356]|uniref:DUF3267 domain-containing protein n=1 Tax=Dyadobacter sp. CY356 TaxID=2906442 RepID=UPI001F38D318|nr:DUF3267 domain-containing protein [Dyadobacter sp. CY356]MCF0054801.1 DUF3267 domain-containing protein [Dyadobacter sp. CY356]
MNLDPEQLNRGDFILLDTLGHMDIVPFIRKYIKKRTRASLFYMSINLLFLACAGWYLGKNVGNGGFSLDDGVTHLSYGLALAFTLIPLHEYIHVLAYKSQGAQHTSYDSNLKKFYFMAIADKFVANRKEFQIVALAPFVVISLGLLILMFFTGKLWTLTIMGMLVVHTACCSGDFGLLSYFDFRRDKELLTYDDKEKGISYFYTKANLKS